MTMPLELSAQATPNPNAIKYTLNRVIASRGVTYREAAGEGPDWAKRLLGVAGIAQVFAMHNFISVTKRPDADWNQLGPAVERVLRDVFAAEGRRDDSGH